MELTEKTWEKLKKEVEKWSAQFKEQPQELNSVDPDVKIEDLTTPRSLLVARKISSILAAATSVSNFGVENILVRHFFAQFGMLYPRHNNAVRKIDMINKTFD